MCNTGNTVQLRYCQCANGTAGTPGLDCPGFSYNLAPCNTQPCCTYSGQWTQWSTCVNCSSGATKMRTIPCTCISGSPVITCSGVQPFELALCSPLDCCQYSTDWNSWNPCSVTCGGGLQNRTQRCLCAPSSPPSYTCSGNPLVSYQPCNTFTCGM